MTNEMYQIERTGNLIDQYVLSFGKARIAFYIFPALEKHKDFTRFLNSFSAALKRANCRPGNSWTYDSNRGCYNLILIVNGYFRNDMNDVTDVAQRIWKLYSPYPLQFITEMPVTDSSLCYDKTRIIDILNRMEFTSSNPQRLLPSHQRTFSCSRLF